MYIYSFFSSSAVWNEIRENQSIVEWWKLLWFPINIPKHTFIAWLAIKNALSTGAKLLHCGFKGDVHCSFCRNGIEDREHLFFYV
jgi:hypothetical protein